MLCYVVSTWELTKTDDGWNADARLLRDYGHMLADTGIQITDAVNAPEVDHDHFVMLSFERRERGRLVPAELPSDLVSALLIDPNYTVIPSAGALTKVERDGLKAKHPEVDTLKADATREEVKRLLCDQFRAQRKGEVRRVAGRA